MDIRRLDTSISDASLGSVFDPWGDHPVGWANARVASIYNVEKAYGSTGGTTVSNFICVCTLVSLGDQVLLERASHGSVLNSLNMGGAHPVWIRPEFDQSLGVNLCATVSGIREALERAPNAKVAVLTSPAYHGVVGHLKQVIAELHRNGLTVVVDAAHGANYPFHENLPTSAVEAGADFVTLSIHKSTEAISQGSLVLINTSDPKLLDAFLDAVNSSPAISTSPNFGILASVEEAVVNLDRYGYERISTALDLAEDFREQVRAITPKYVTWGPEQAVGRPGFAQLDATRVTVDVSGTGLTGIEVEQLMQVERPGLPPVVAELGDPRNVLFLVTWGNDWSDIDIALAHLQHIAIEHKRPRRPAGPITLAALPPQAMPPCEAQLAIKRGHFRMVDGRNCIGDVSGETVAVYPPGWPVVVQGERITRDVFDFLRETAGLGANLKGASNNFNRVRVMA